jgi:uncharacterized protein
VYQQVLVTVTEVDAGRKRISLSMKTDEPRTTAPRNITKQKIEVKEVNVIDNLAALKAKFS